MLKTEAIAKFLHSLPYDIAKRYTQSMEVQVLVARDEGDPISGSYRGRKWLGYTDGLTTWKHFRVPWNAGTKPEYIDSDIRFNIAEHTEAIGMTGWDWENKRSRWVGFDFDSIIGHKEGLAEDELESIKIRLQTVDFISLYSSTSSHGIHIYVMLDYYPVNTHTEHASIARSILNKISALSGLQLKAKVDCLGGNMWVWHRRAIDESYKCLSQGNVLTHIPANWREYLSVVSKKHIVNTEQGNKDILVASNNQLPLDEEHLKLLKWFEDSSSLWWFDGPKQMLVCHTYDLKRAHLALNLKGYFNTLATGKDQGHDQNCFAFPVSAGGWLVRRHSPNINEHESWFTDRSGWTTTYYNRLPNIRTATGLVGGVEDDRFFVFSHLFEACRALIAMGIDIEIPTEYKNRPARIKETATKIILEFNAEESDLVPKDWVKQKRRFIRSFFRPKVVEENELPDDLIRHVVISGSSLGWYINLVSKKWTQVAKGDVSGVMLSNGVLKSNIEILAGQLVLNSWEKVNKPFKPEYPGAREWNLGAAQFKYNPNEGDHLTWNKILRHCGKNLNSAVLEDNWCKEHGIDTGELYLLLWLACVFQYPTEPVPYLFFCGPQNCGKSVFHEALDVLVTKGITRADNALINPSGFNGELSTAIFAVVEETNLSKNGPAKDRIKDWVTGRHISIHTKGKTPYDIRNCTHWIQCANKANYCPILPGDTRIVMVDVPVLTSEIPKPQLLDQCEAEAPAILHTLLNFEIPFSRSRLKIPIITTSEKRQAQEQNETALEQYVRENIHTVPGQSIKFADFYAKFQDWLDSQEKFVWTARKTSKELPFIRGRMGSKNQLYIGNVSWGKGIGRNSLIIKEGRLV